MHLARRVRNLTPSITLEIAAKAARMRARGDNVIPMGAGQPDFPTPAEALEAARASIADGHVLYTPTSGIPELRQAAAEALGRWTGRAWDADQVTITCGAKEALALSILALTGEGDEIVVPTPYWLSYDPMCAVSGATMVEAATRIEDGYKLAPEALRATITDRTRVLLLNSPNNPTGAVYSEHDFEALAEVLADHPDITVLSDEIYTPFVYEGRHVSPSAHPALADRTIVVNGVSKAYAMTGWRIGFCGAPSGVSGAIQNMKSHLTANAATPSQHAALAALELGDDYSRRMVEVFRRRRDLVIDAVSKMPDVSMAEPAGAFYAFVRVDSHFGERVSGSVDFCSTLLEEARVAAVPGAAFGEDRCIRLSYAVSDELLEEALSRIAAFLGG